jgi:hypothetical protein
MHHSFWRHDLSYHEDESMMFRSITKQLSSSSAWVVGGTNWEVSLSSLVGAIQIVILTSKLKFPFHQSGFDCVSMTSQFACNATWMLLEYGNVPKIWVVCNSILEWIIN